ncbi:O-antigen ligase family protein [Candidatus Pelagibacter communis]|uniref:O-antigen ligase family protein n=1 Tax=Pelagibacter ubique TaxID=198252 RepID=UPI00065B3FB2|nr:O-antigen ligase family protein [Candidatus Pelagibacter ubique]
MSRVKYFDNLLYFLISSVIFITAGNFIEDYKKLIFLKLIIIFLILSKIDFIKETKSVLKKNRTISIILILFIISVTFSFITSPSKIHQFAFQWLRIRYLDTITDIFFFIFLYLYFKDRIINYDSLVKSVIFPGLTFSIFVIYIFISNKGLSHSNKEIIFFDGVRMVGMLVTFLVAFYLGCLHSTLKEKKILNLLILTTFITLAILLMGRGTIIAILATYFFVCIILFLNKEKFKNELLIFISSFFLSILIAQIIFQIILPPDEFIFFSKSKHGLFYAFDRINLWKYGYIIFLENPYFGKGPGGFAIAAYNDFYAQKSYGDLLITNYLTHNHPHNFIIQFIVEWGIVGTSLIFILLIRLSIISLKYFFKFKINHLLISGVSIIGLASHGLVDGALYHATFTFYFVLSLSILCSELSKINNYKS